MQHEPRVLIVDDDVDLAEITCEVIGLSGIAAIYRTTVADAIDAMARYAGSVAVLFTDVNMQSPMSGIELAIYVAQEWPDVAICVTSGFEHDRPRRLPDKAEFLVKPWRTPDLIAILHRSGLGIAAT